MPTTAIEVRDVPQDLYRQLEARAALEGVSLSDLVLRELWKAVARPPRKEVLARLRAQPLRRLRRPTAEILREEREAR